MQKKKERATLIFDGSCPICSSTVKWIGENEVEDSFDMLPCQSDRMHEQFPEVEPVECMKAMRLALPDGTVFVGEEALPEIFARLRRYRFAALLFRLPGARPLSRIAYRWFAARRYRIADILSHRDGDEKKAA
jgi:predicted DCC family thiol-disulfide oxidoreductase YuxK